MNKNKQDMMNEIVKIYIKRKKLQKVIEKEVIKKKVKETE